MTRSGNPALRENLFSGNGALFTSDAGFMTVEGTEAKALILWVILASAAAFTWQQATTGAGASSGYVAVGAILGFFVALTTSFKPAWSSFTAPIYAGLEGLFLGGVSASFELKYPGIAVQACGGTLSTFLVMLVAFRTGIIRPTGAFTRGVMVATGGIALLYLVEMVLGMFGVQVPLIASSGPIGVAISGAVCFVAALNLVVDFDFIAANARRGAPKYMEWYAAFALTVTLVWLYLEILRLLARIRDRD